MKNYRRSKYFRDDLDKYYQFSHKLTLLGLVLGVLGILVILFLVAK